MRVYLKDCPDGVELRLYMPKILDAANTDFKSSEDKFSCELHKLITGQPQDAAHGVIHYMRVEPNLIYIELPKGIDAIVAEFERYNGLFAEEARECMQYIMYERAGQSTRQFQDGQIRDANRSGETLADFHAHPNSRTARLEMAHVASLRIYTTSAYKVLNSPFRDIHSTAPHPFPVTIYFLKEAIGKLRAVGALEDKEGSSQTNTLLDLWRGMRNTEVTEEFMQHGGTELAPMSTTSDLEVAVQYSSAAQSLLFKVKTDSFMQRGASIQYLSAFPHEAEFLYPPLTFLKPTGKRTTLRHKDVSYTVVEVVPHFGS